MSDPVRQLIGIVIRADGTVPFDKDVPEQTREHMIRHLAQMGHTVQDVHGCRDAKIADFDKKTHAQMEKEYHAKIAGPGKK